MPQQEPQDKVKDFITKDGTFLVIVEGERFYEFRDLTPSDLLWINKNEHSDKTEDFDDYINSLGFLVMLSKRLIICCNSEIEQEDWHIFLDISKRVQENVLAQCIPWENFLELAFAFGHKSFSCLNGLMDLPMTTVLDMQQTLVDFYERQAAALDAAQGIKR